VRQQELEVPMSNQQSTLKEALTRIAALDEPGCGYERNILTGEMARIARVALAEARIRELGVRS